jgi:beta-lactamase class D
MRFVVPCIAVLLLSAAPAHAKPNFDRLFAGRDGCFELYDLKANKLLVRYNPAHCAKRVSPASTFKVPLALMAYDAGILKDENSPMKWNGTKSNRVEWDRDQTAASWMKKSVVWFSQRLTPKLGMKRVKDYLARFRYGNKDMSGGLTKAWLQSTLTISPDEQLRFWRQFWRGELPVSKHAFDVTKKITYIGTSPSGWILHGKTGSGAIVSEKGKLLQGSGWFVGHVGRGDREYVYVAHYSDRAPPSDTRPPGWIAREIATTALAQMGLH